MKITTEVIDLSKTPKFPVFRRWKKTGLIVMFFAPESGMVVEEADSNRTLGWIDLSGWVECNDSQWEPVNCKVVIEG